MNHHALPTKQERLIRRSWNMDQIHKGVGKVRRETQAQAPSISQLLSFTKHGFLSEVLNDQSPGGQTSHSLQIGARLTEWSSAPGHTKALEDSESGFWQGLQRSRALYELGSAVDRDLGSLANRVSNSVCQVLSCLFPRLPSTQGPAHLRTPSLTDHPSTAEALSSGDFPCSSYVFLSYLSHFLSLFHILADNSLN